MDWIQRGVGEPPVPPGNSPYAQDPEKAILERDSTKHTEKIWESDPKTGDRKLLIDRIKLPFVREIHIGGEPCIIRIEKKETPVKRRQNGDKAKNGK